MDAADQTMVAALNQMRLDENRSYADLASQIGIDPGALYKILNDQSEPYDRTLHKIRQFMDTRGKRKKTA
jgi:transcriptional regulator with XRE-family HTH domain